MLSGSDGSKGFDGNAACGAVWSVARTHANNTPREKRIVHPQTVVAAPQGLARVVAFLVACGEERGGVQGYVLAQLVACLDLGPRPQRPAMARVDRQERLGDERLVVVVVIVHGGARLHRRGAGGTTSGWRSVAGART